MNRAERRRQKKAGIKVQKEPTLNLKVSDFDHMVSHAEKSAKERATAAAIHEIDQQILEHDEAYSLDIDAMVLWTLHVYLGFGKKRLERFYRDMLKEHIHMREVYEMDDTYPERYKLKELCNVDVEALLRTGKDFVKNNLSVSAAQHIIDTGKLVESDNPDYPICIDNQWYFEGVEVKKTAKKAQLSSMYGEMKEGK